VSNCIISYHENVWYRDLHGDRDDGNPVESTGMGTVVAGIHRDGNNTCGSPAGMEFIAAGTAGVF